MLGVYECVRMCVWVCGCSQENSACNLVAFTKLLSYCFMRNLESKREAEPALLKAVGSGDSLDRGTPSPSLV